MQVKIRDILSEKIDQLAEEDHLLKDGSKITEEWNFEKEEKESKPIDPLRPGLVNESSNSSSEDDTDTIGREVVNFLKNVQPIDEKRGSKIKNT